MKHHIVLQVIGLGVIHSDRQYNRGPAPWPREISKVLDGYKVGSLNWSVKDLGAIETELALIYQHWGLTQTPLALFSAAIISISYWRKHKTTPQPRRQNKPSFSLSHKVFKDLTKIHIEEKKYSVNGNSHPDPGNCRPILEAEYIIINS